MKDVIQIEYLLLENGQPASKVLELAMFSDMEHAKKDFECVINWNTVLQKARLIFQDVSKINACVITLLKNGTPIYVRFINSPKND